MCVGPDDFDRDRCLVVRVGDLGGQVLELLLFLLGVGVFVFPEFHVEAEKDALESEAYFLPRDQCADDLE